MAEKMAKAIVDANVQHGDSVTVLKVGEGWIATGKGGAILGTAEDKQSLMDSLKAVKDRNKGKS